MRIVNLIENTEGVVGCAFAHGLSFYIETKNHNLLVDLGPSELTVKNAEKLGINLAHVDSVILSHGHYDHGGGIIPFVKCNSVADIYMQKSALGDYYADDGKDKKDKRYRYIGIDDEIKKLLPVKFVDGDYTIDDELELFTIEKKKRKLPFTNKRILRKIGGKFVQDDFIHEQYLVIRDGEKSVLVSGCAHNGILNILDEYKRKFNAIPDVVISGFHLMKKTEYTEDEIKEITEMASDLSKYPTKFITCHCTGSEAYQIMKNIMGRQLQYIHSGDSVIIFNA